MQQNPNFHSPFLIISNGHKIVKIFTDFTADLTKELAK